MAQPTVVITPVHTNICPWGGPPVTQCCLEVVVTIPMGSTLSDFQFYMSGGTPPPDANACWDFSCAGSNASPQAHLTVTNPRTYVTANDGMSFHYSTALAGPATFQFMLCPLAGCSSNWSTMHYRTATTGAFTAYSNGGCSGDSPTCPSCDEVDLYTGGPCYEEICLTKHWPGGSPITTFTLHFNPALPNYPCTPTGCAAASPSLDAGSSGWAVGLPTNGGADLTVTAIPPNSLDACQTICIDIPKCDPVSRTVTVTTDGSCTTGAVATFKISGTDPTTISKDNLQNYPNPLSDKNQFKTTIPFQIAGSGDAKISIFDETGRKVYTDVQNFYGSGSHFFYFTGEQLPAGKYFYTIESPLGAVIVKQSLLIVK